MLSIGKVRSSGLDYYTQEGFALGDAEYPARDHGEDQGRWIGSDLDGYGVNMDTDRISTEQLARVLQGQRADTGAPLPGADGGVRAPTTGHQVHGTVQAIALNPASVETFPRTRAGKAAASVRVKYLGPTAVLRSAANRDGWVVGQPLLDVNGAPVVAEIPVSKHREGVLAYDLTFSAPKSVSVLSVDELATVRKCHEAAVEAALESGLTAIGWSRRGHDGVEPVSATIGAAALFTHRQSRGGDPQIHSHVLIGNRVLCEDGVWRALDARVLYDHAATMGTTYQAVLRANLTHDLGVAWTPVNDVGVAEIKGVPVELMKLWSSRSNVVGAAAGKVLERANVTRALAGRSALTVAEETQIRQQVTLKTRPSKEVRDQALADGRTLQERWTEEAEAAGYDLTAVHAQVIGVPQHRKALGIPQHRKGLEGSLALDAMAARSLATVASRASTFSRRHVAREVAQLVPGGSDPETVAAWIDRVTDLALGSDECLQVAQDGVSDVVLFPGGDMPTTGRPGMVWYTTRAAMAAENRILDRAVGSMGAGWGVVPTEVLNQTLNDTYAVDGLVLDDGQMLAVDGLVSSGDGVEIIDVMASSSKALVIGRAAQAWRASGQRVIVLAPQAGGAKVLADRTGVEPPSASVAQAVNRWNTYNASVVHDGPDWTVQASGVPAGGEDATPWRLDARTIVIVDHAGTLTRDQIDQLTAATDRGYAKLVLIGDTSTLSPSKTTTGMFKSLRDVVGGRTLTTDIDQAHEPWEHVAIAQLRDGDTHALDAYDTAGRLHSTANRETGIQEAADRFLTEKAEGLRAVVVAPARVTTDDVNAVIAERLHGGPKPLPTNRIGGRAYAVGDLILLRSTDTQNKYGLTEGKHGLAQAERNVTAAYTRRAGLRAKREAAFARVAYLAEHRSNSKLRAAARLHTKVLGAKIDTLDSRIIDLKERVAVLKAEREVAPFVRAGSRAEVIKISTAGGVTAKEILPDGTAGKTFTLTRSYVHQHAAHAWAMTVPDAVRAGIEVDTATLVGSAGTLSAEAVYGGLSLAAANSAVVWDGKVSDGHRKRTGHMILASAMDRTVADVSIHERKTMLATDRRRGDVVRMRAVADRAETLTELADRSHALTERVTSNRPVTHEPADEEKVTRYTAALMTVDGGTEVSAALTAQQGWGQTIDALEQAAETAGIVDTESLLVAAVQERDLDVSRPVGPVLGYRLRGTETEHATQQVTSAATDLRRWTVRAEQLEEAGQPAKFEIARRDQAAAVLVSARLHAINADPLSGASQHLRSFQADLDARYKARLARDTDTAITTGNIAAINPGLGHRPEDQPNATPEEQKAVKAAQAAWRREAEGHVEYRSRWMERSLARQAVMLPEQSKARTALVAATKATTLARERVANLAHQISHTIEQARGGGLGL